MDVIYKQSPHLKKLIFRNLMKLRQKFKLKKEEDRKNLIHL